MRRCLTLHRSPRATLLCQPFVRCLHRDSHANPHTRYDLQQPPPPPPQRPAPKSQIRKQLSQWQTENASNAYQDQLSLPNDDERSQEMAAITLDHDLSHDALEYEASSEMQETDSMSILNQGDLVEVMFVYH